MAGQGVNILALFLACFAAFYQFKLKGLMLTGGVGRIVENLNNQHCQTVPLLQACEKIVLHQPTGVLYLACSTPASRVAWTPSLDYYNASGRSLDDYVATYDPQNSKITHLTLTGLPSGISVHGMDVVPSASNPKDLFVYLVNHQPFSDRDAKKFGANSTIEIFKTRVGGKSLTHLHTIHSPSVIISPNDLVGSADGKSFHFTNDFGQKTGIMRQVHTFIGNPVASVGYCHVDQGCKIATDKISDANGIASVNDTFYVANVYAGSITVLERQADNSLVVTDVIPGDRPIDNLSIDADGMVWAAGFAKVFHALFNHFPNPSVETPATALRLSVNTGEGVFYGKKFKYQKVFEDSGKIASGTTSAVYDSVRGRLFLHGLASPHLAICKL